MLLNAYNDCHQITEGNVKTLYAAVFKNGHLHYPSFDLNPTDHFKKYLAAITGATEKVFLPMALLFIRKTPKEAPLLSSKHMKKV